MIRLMCANPESTRPVVDKVFSFEEAKAAYAYLESQAHVGKVVIKVSKN
jgi:NADPH:quinone reductase-like Zn-dependent oxidoreductase